MANIVDISSRVRFRNLNAKPAQPEDDTAYLDRSVGYDDGFDLGLCPDDYLAVASLAAIEAEIAAVELPKGSLAEWLDNRLGLNFFNRHTDKAMSYDQFRGAFDDKVLETANVRLGTGETRP